MEGLTRAPALNRPGLHWLNIDAPLDLPDLRGKLVILDFWTYCCINCMHVVPTLTRLEEKFPDTVVVIGVHSPKFAAERELENVRAAVQRLGVRHPVIHDSDMVLWREYAIRAWPTLTFISPDGMIIGNMPGEARAENLILGVGNMLKEWQDAGILSPSHLELTPAPAHTGSFDFPGKIKPIPGTPKRWALADSGHHQVVMLDDEGAELHRIGSGTSGFRDSGGDTSAFCQPQGLAATGRYIYVADTGNHAIRRIDLDDFTVCTLAGTGERGLELGLPAPGGETALASPWDLELADDTLYFANAGTHQVGQLDLTANTVAVLAGTGGENIVDGKAGESLLAQPSALALSADGAMLYFVDSETSAVRALDFNGKNREPAQIKTLIGIGLFDFGTATGSFEDARLQHPLGLASLGDGLVVADSFNNRLCRLDLAAHRVEEIDIAVPACEDGTCRPLSEPAGVIWDRDTPDRVRLLVSDTNNHRILEVDLDAGSARRWAG